MLRGPQEKSYWAQQVSFPSSVSYYYDIHQDSASDRRPIPRAQWFGVLCGNDEDRGGDGQLGHINMEL